MEKNKSTKHRKGKTTDGILPQEILELILSYLDYHLDIVIWSLISKRFNHHIMNNEALRKGVEKYRFLHKISVLPFENNTFIIALAGPGGVGKSSSWIKFVYPQVQPENYDPTIEDMDRIKVTVDGEEYTAIIVDHGSSEVEDLIQFYKNRVHGVYLVYDSVDILGIAKAREVLQSVQTWKGVATFPLLIAGNKLDLAERNFHRIRPNIGKAFADQHNALFFETCARDGRNITEAFMALIRHTIDVHKVANRRAKIKPVKKYCVVM